MILVLDAWYGICLGRIDLPTGAVVACDPFFCGVAVPFACIVEPGSYPVYIDVLNLEGVGDRVSIATIVFDDTAQPEFFVEASARNGWSSYFVDSGFGCFMDEKARQSLVRNMREFYAAYPNGNYYSDIIEKELRADWPGRSGQADHGLWTIHRLPGADLNVALFRSGLGDGWYRSYWGVCDGDHRIVSLVTDFGFGQFFPEEPAGFTSV